MAKKPKEDETEDGEIHYANESVTETELGLHAATLVGDVRDVMLSTFRTSKKPWEQMNESEQRETVERFTKCATNLTTQAVRTIAANGRKTIVAQVEKVEIKDALKITAKCAKSEETMLMMGAAQGHALLLVAADAAEFEGERAPAEIDPDQGDLERELGGKCKRVA